MAVKDDWFVETINSISPNVTKEIKETLSPIKMTMQVHTLMKHLSVQSKMQ